MSKNGRGIICFVMSISFVLAVSSLAQAQDPKAGNKPVLSSETKPFLGIWESSMDWGKRKVQVDIEIKASGNELSCSIRMPVLGIPPSEAGVFSIAGRNLKVCLMATLLPFDGILSDDGLQIAGSYTAGSSEKIGSVFRKVDKVSPIVRRQTPVPPYPYEEMDVVFVNKKDGTKLAGTITYPKGRGPFPAAILVSGATPHDRNEEGMGGHRFFQVLADDLTKRGIAVLRYDDRGVAHSTGDYEAASLLDFADDAEAGFDFLAAQSFIDKKRIGFVGHSEGGVVSQIVAGRSPEPAFIVLMAGPVIPAYEVLKYQYQLAKQADPVSKAVAEKCEQALEIVRTETDIEKIKPKIRALFNLPMMPEQQRKAFIDMHTNPKDIFYITFDPLPYLEKVNCPILMLGGDKDVAVPYKENSEALKRIMGKLGKTKYITVELNDINHLFQTTTNGAMALASFIDETMSPQVMKIIGEWILGVSKN
jgi:uncharacterized protein